MASSSNFTGGVPYSSYIPPTSEPTLQVATPILPFVSDAVLASIGPIVIYWIVSLLFHYIDQNGLLEQYRIHTPEEVLKRNHVSKYEVLKDVIIQQIVQFVVAMALGYYEPDDMSGSEPWDVYNLSQWIGYTVSTFLTVLGINPEELGVKTQSFLLASGSPAGLFLANLDWRWKVAEGLYYIVIPILRLGVAIFVLDTWQYFWHRLMHQVPFLYRTLHSRHHRLYVPYAFGALYNHPIEGLILDTLGAGLGFKVSGMSTKGSVYFFSFSTMKTVDDHCGYKIPYDPLQLIFSNNAEYHDIHHQGWGIKSNFSQPFLICWDRWLGTMYTGGDSAERNRRTRERVHKQIEQEALKKGKGPVVQPANDEYAARRSLPEEDDTDFIKTSTVNEISSKATDVPKQRRRTRTITLADVTGKDMAESVKETEKWVNDIVGNVSGAKVR